MRNVFDQYSQPENRLTHALACTLDADRSLLRPFLAWAGARDVPPVDRLQITEQQVPGSPVSGDEEEGRGLPDACVFDANGWALVIEAKVQSGVSADQLRRHLSTAKRYGFNCPSLLLLCVDEPPQGLPEQTAVRAWRELYRWFRERESTSQAAGTLTRYMEVFESRMIEQDYSIRGTITMFDGLRFDDGNPYTYSEAKRLVRLLGDELQKRSDLLSLGVDPDGERRAAITGRAASAVWDFLPLMVARGADSFTAFPHMTLALGQRIATAAITVPHRVRGEFRSRLRAAGEDEFFTLLRTIAERLQPVLARSAGSKCMIYVTQRHYHSQRSAAEVDARLDADLRTIVPGRRKEAKYQPEWIRAIYQVLTNKRSNIQLGLEAHLPYSCSIVRSADAVDLFAESWAAMFPIVEFVLKG